MNNYFEYADFGYVAGGRTFAYLGVIGKSADSASGQDEIRVKVKYK
jgi:hypothetical protein